MVEVAMTILAIYLSGTLLTTLMWLWMLKQVFPASRDFWASIKGDKYTLLSLGLLWFIILPFVLLYWLAKRIGHLIYCRSNGRLAKGAM
jgi:hypothetical protein